MVILSPIKLTRPIITVNRWSLSGDLSLEIVIDLGWSSIDLGNDNFLLLGGFMHWCGNDHTLVLGTVIFCCQVGSCIGVGMATH